MPRPDAPSLPLARSRRQVPDGHAVALALALAVLVALVVLPLVVLVWRSLTPGGSLSLDAYRAAFADVPLGELALTTLLFASGAALLGLLLGTALALALVRTDLPGRHVLVVMVLSPLVLPGVLQTIAWIFLAAPASGALSGVPGMPSAFGLGGMVLVEGLRLAPLAMLLVGAALRSGDPALEEAARVAGASRGAVLRHVTLPLLRPALAATGLLLALRALGSFEVPTLLGVPDRTWVFTSRVWLALGSSGDRLAEAAAASVPLLVLTLAGTAALVMALRRPRAREVVTSRGHRRARVELGAWRLPVLAGVVAYVGIAVIAPLGALVWMSLQPFLTPLGSDALGRSSLDAYREVLGDELVLQAVANSVEYATAAALVACALAAVVGWTALRGRSRLRVLPDAVAFLPMAVPGLVLGVALLVVLVRGPAVLYGTAAALVLGYVARYLPYATRIGGAGLARIGGELEDVARVSGIGWWPTVRRVVIPLAGASLAAAWLAVFTIALTDVSLSLVLYAPGTEVLGVRIWSLYESGRWDQLAALGVLTMLAVAVLALAGLALGRLSARWGRAAA